MVKTATNENFLNYVIYSDGQVFSNKTRKFLTPRPNGANGHPAVKIGGKTIRLAKLIIETFGIPPHGGRLRYHDGDPWNCAFENLAYEESTLPISEVPIGLRAIAESGEYFVTPDGRVFSTRSRAGDGRLRECLQYEDSDGYLQVTIWLGSGVSVTRKVHVIIATTFHGRPVERLQVRHLDGDKRNNASRNLCWGTAFENANDRESHGHTHRRYSKDRVTQAANAFLTGAATSLAAAASEHGVSVSSIRWHIAQRRKDETMKTYREEVAP